MSDTAAVPQAAGDVPFKDTRPQWFGHPAQLARLFTTEMWERFGYYGMRALLTLFLADHFLFSDNVTNGLYGAFTALVYLTPLIGGLLADRYLGSKRSVKFGALVMAVGYLALCFGGEAAKPFFDTDGQRYEVQVVRDGENEHPICRHGRQALRDQGPGRWLDHRLSARRQHLPQTIAKGGFASGGERSEFFVLLMLGRCRCVIVGNGFFKPNISTIVGSLYAAGRPAPRCRLHHLLHGHQPRARRSPVLRAAAGGVVRLVGGLRAGRGRHAAVAWALIQFDGGRLERLWRAAGRQRPDRDRC